MIAKGVRPWVWFVPLLWMLPNMPLAAWDAGTDSVAKGQALYRTHCASCHGDSARGDGWVGKALRTPPTDLTMLAHKNGGIFP
jgi:mono/diheme cytochrome c family protein